MRSHKLRKWLWISWLGLFPLLSYAQHEDCRTAFLICSDSSFSFTPTGPGIDDFANPNNDQGCLFTGENISAWFYFELREDMPLDSNTLGFLITDTLPDYFIDYDFAIYGPNLSCDSLGSPYRCSFARLPNNGNLGPGSVVSTGFSAAAQDTVETFNNADGYLKPMEVRPGDGFFLVIDFFVSALSGGVLEDFDSTAVQGFNFSWTGTAAPWLNCVANPNCDQVTVAINGARDFCAGEQLQLEAVVTNTAGQESYTWTEANGFTSFLSDPHIPNPTLEVPPGFSGTLEYTLLVKEGACEHTDQVTINVQSGVVPGITGEYLICLGDSSTLTAQPGFESYLWSTGDTVPTIRVPGGETYTLTVTTADNAVCPGVGQFTVVISQVERPFIRGDANICEEGRQTTLLRAPLGYQGYLWQNKDSTSTDEDFRVRSAGVVRLTVIDSIGCPTTDSVYVERLPEYMPEIFGDGNLCDGTLDTLIVDDAFTPTAWSANILRPLDLFQRSVEVNQPGTYSVTVEDSLGCIGRSSFEVLGRPNPVPAITGDLTFCPEGNTTLDGPAGYQAYEWSTSETSSSIIVAAAGNISLTVTDTFGCQGSTGVLLDTLPTPQPVISGQDYLCEGGSTSLTVDNYATYQWSTGDSTSTVTVTAAMAYTVTVTDANGCAGMGQYTVVERAAPQPAILGDTVICPGAATSLQSDTLYATYQWSTGAITPATSVNQGGLVSLTVTDTFGCPGMVERNVTQLSSPVPQINGDTAFCAGDSVQLMAEPGFQSYQWPDGSIGLAFTAQSGGVLTLAVVDTNGCQGSNTILLEERLAPQFAISGDTLFCANESAFIAAPSGFTDYLWSNGQRSRAIEIFDPGTYEVTVIDDLGCVGSASVSADTVSFPQPEILGLDYVCEAGTQLLYSGTYSAYQWSTGASSDTINISQPGIYSLTVTDANGCQNTAVRSIAAQPAPIPVITGDPILCPGETVVLATTLPYAQYNWSTGASTPSVTTGYVPEISLEVTDSLGCQGQARIVLSSVDNPAVSIAGQLDICDGEGAILQATPGFVSYQWSNGSDSLATTGLVNGIYTVTVTDENGCSAIASEFLEVNDNPRPDIQGELLICEGETTTLSVGDNFLTYSWSNGDTSRFTEVRESGTYIIEVESPGGCYNQDTVEVLVNIPRPSPLANAILDVCDGSTLELDAGAGFLSYQWSTGATSRIIQTTQGGDYQLSVVDTNGCRTGSNIRVNLQALPRPSITAPDVFCKGTPVTLLANGNFRTYEWSNGASGDMIEINQGGRYELSVTDNNGCEASVAVDLAEKDAPDIEITGDVKICKGDSTRLSVRDGLPYYLWTDDTNLSSIVVTQPGNYGVLVVGENGCVTADEVQVLFRADPMPVISGDLVKCENTTGILEANTDYDSYYWLPGGDTTRQIQIDSAGLYELRVVDDFGCENIARTIVREAAAPVLDLQAPPGICPGDTLILQVDSTYADIAWSTGASGASLAITTPGLYGVSVTNSANCTTADSVTLIPFSNPNFNFLGDTVVCAGESARIAIDRTFPEIQWSTGEQDRTSILVDSSAVYQVAVTNSDGCTASASRTVIVNPLPPALTGPDTVLNCYYPQIQLGVPSTAYPTGVSLSWQGPGIAPTETAVFQPAIAVPGSYTLQTRDSLTGCWSPVTSVEVGDAQYLPNVALYSDGMVDCLDQTALIDAAGTTTGASFGYRWLFGPQDSLVAQNTLTVKVDKAGLYSLMVLDSLTGCTNTDSIALVIDVNIPMAGITPVDVLSCAMPTQTLQAAGANGDNIHFTWIADAFPLDSLTGPSLVVTEPGRYTLIAENLNNGCSSSDQIEVSRNDTLPDISAGPDIELDCNQPDIQLGAPFSKDRWIVTWTKAGDPEFQTALKRPIVTEAGQYNLEVFDPVNGCISYDTILVTVYEDRPRQASLDVQPERCFGDADGQITVEQVIGGEGPYLYSWNGATFSANPVLSQLPAGRFTFTVQDVRGCELDTMVTIRQGVDPLIELGPDRFIHQGEYVRLTALENVEDETIVDLRWLQPDTLACPTCPVQRLAPLRTTEYIATLVDVNGCRSTDSVTVFVDRTRGVFIPNAFSPNGDGYNDRITVFASANVKTVRTFRIYERRGNLMFQRDNFAANDLSLGWDGFHRGQLMNSQVFVYFAEVEFQDGEVVTFEGSFSLIR